MGFKGLRGLGSGIGVRLRICPVWAPEWFPLKDLSGLGSRTDVRLRIREVWAPDLVSAYRFVGFGLRNWCPLKDLSGLGSGIGVRLRICKGLALELGFP